MKKKNFKCCGKKYKDKDHTKFNSKCLRCKKGGVKNKNNKCYCYGSPTPRKAKITRQKTQYYDEYMNYTILCNDCFEESQEYWTERWNEYYSMIL